MESPSSFSFGGGGGALERERERERERKDTDDRDTTVARERPSYPRGEVKAGSEAAWECECLT